MVLLFLDGDQRWMQNWYARRGYQFREPVSLFVFIDRSINVADKSFVMMARGNREGQTRVYAASSLGVQVFGSSFDDLFAQVREHRADFQGSTVSCQQKFMTTAFWYELDVPNSYVALQALHRFLVSGIQSFWLTDELKSETERQGPKLADVFNDKRASNASQYSPCGDTDNGRFLKFDSLILESICLFVFGLVLSATGFVLMAGLQVDQFLSNIFKLY